MNLMPSAILTSVRSRPHTGQTVNKSSKIAFICCFQLYHVDKTDQNYTLVLYRMYRHFFFTIGGNFIMGLVKGVIMNPQKYLSQNGVRYFNEIVEHCNNLEINLNVDSIELSMLADQYDKYECAVTAASENEPGLFNQYPNGTVQINGFSTIFSF